MGIFSKLFGSSSDIEKKLEDQYIPFFQITMGISTSQAKSTFLDMLKKAKEEAITEGTINLPQNFGNILIEKESTDEEIKSMLLKRREEGVRDDDIRWWWNKHDIERRLILNVATMVKLAIYLKLIDENGLSRDEARDEAMKGVRKRFPMFGDSDDITHATGEDRPLPIELEDRVNSYVEKRAQSDPEKFNKEIEESSTVNALIRKEIKKGNI